MQFLTDGTAVGHRSKFGAHLGVCRLDVALSSRAEWPLLVLFVCLDTSRSQGVVAVQWPPGPIQGCRGAFRQLGPRRDCRASFFFCSMARAAKVSVCVGAWRFTRRSIQVLLLGLQTAPPVNRFAGYLVSVRWASGWSLPKCLRALPAGPHGWLRATK